MNRNGNTLTITGLALGEASITVTSGNAQTTIPIVVADKVLDVPHIRQEKSLWCWAACAQMLVKHYDSSVTDSQTTMAGIGQDTNSPTNDPEGFTEIKRIIENYINKTATREYADTFTAAKLRAQIDAGNPVIYLSTRIPLDNPDIENPPGHFRVVYGYYLYTKPNGSQEYVYLAYDPWDTCARANLIHLDIWRQSWTNIINEKNISVDTDRVPIGSYYSDNNYYASWFMWCE